jgi:hypothetical protein
MKWVLGGAGAAFLLVIALVGYLVFEWQSARGNDTWVYSPAGGWTDHTSDPAPSIRTFAGMATDERTGRIVLFGGRAAASTVSPWLGDTWTFDGRHWHLEAPAAAPPAQDVTAIAYDPAAGHVLLLGSPASGPGPNGAPDPAETWTWDGTSWSRLTPAHSPPGRYGAALAYDAVSKRMLVFGGAPVPDAEGGVPLFNDTWAWSGSDWTPVPSAHVPPARAYAAMAADPAGGVLLFGGTSGVPQSLGSGRIALGDTWHWDGADWTLVAQTGPAARFGAAVAPLARGGVVLFGGQLGCGHDHFAKGCSVDPYLDDTWTWSGSRWHPSADGSGAAHPRARGGAAAAYLAGSIFLFGGPDPHRIAFF